MPYDIIQSSSLTFATCGAVIFVKGIALVNFVNRSVIEDESVPIIYSFERFEDINGAKL